MKLATECIIYLPAIALADLFNQRQAQPCARCLCGSSAKPLEQLLLVQGRGTGIGNGEFGR